jgi:DNA-binding NarL/FixJ family response regulator
MRSLQHRQPRPAYHAQAKRPDSVTRREEQVLKLVAWGLTHKQIAQKLGISVKTIESHKARAKTSLQLRDRADIVRYAVNRGWLRWPNPANNGQFRR